MDDVRRRIPINGVGGASDDTADLAADADALARARERALEPEAGEIRDLDAPGDVADGDVTAAPTSARDASESGDGEPEGPAEDRDAAAGGPAGGPEQTTVGEEGRAETAGVEAEAAEGIPGGDDLVPDAADLAEAVAVAIAERDQYLDALLRLKAEFENYRKRSQRETAEVGSRARAAILAEFLPVLDNLDRALSAAEHHEEGKVLEGVRLTHSLFADLLRKEGVQEVEALGQVFDPTVHEALMTQESDEHEEGTVIAVLERGYACGDRVLRPAKVAVSSGPSA